jgi:hypothetical protein
MARGPDNGSGGLQRVGPRFGPQSLLACRVGQLGDRRGRRAEQLVDPVPVFLAPLALEQLLKDPQRQWVSSGIDMALRPVQLIAGDAVAQAIQLSIEYDPQPPLGAGSPATAPQPIVELVRQRGATAG